jgi:hypothetical protein
VIERADGEGEDEAADRVAHQGDGGDAPPSTSNPRSPR